jgi:hypothetical protein
MVLSSDKRIKQINHVAMGELEQNGFIWLRIVSRGEKGCCKGGNKS